MTLKSYEYLNKRKETWRNPRDWSDLEIHEHVVKHIGEDCLFPDRFYVLVKLWLPSEVDPITGFKFTDHARYKAMISSTVGQIIRFGDDAFTEKELFPNGSPYTYGEWVIFRSLERQLFEVNKHRLAIIRDDKLVGFTHKPEEIKTSFDLEYEHVGS